MNMAKFFQRISQVFHDLKHESILCNSQSLSIARQKPFGWYALQEAIARSFLGVSHCPKRTEKGKRNLSRLKRSPQWYGISALSWYFC
jgi:hypothetical protein